MEKKQESDISGDTCNFVNGTKVACVDRLSGVGK